MTQVTIHLQRIGRPARSFVEELVEDDGMQVRTFSLLPPAVSASLSRQFCEQGRIPPGCLIHSAEKFLFYNETFSLIVLRDADGGLLGCYCDIVTRLQKVGADYILTDLILDLWISPNGKIQVLDEAEFQTAVRDGLIQFDLTKMAQTTLEGLTRDRKILQICSSIAYMQVSRP